eukprot:748563-Hanusia_phi.AAC.2
MKGWSRVKNLGSGWGYCRVIDTRPGGVATRLLSLPLSLLPRSLTSELRRLSQLPLPSSSLHLPPHNPSLVLFATEDTPTRSRPPIAIARCLRPSVPRLLPSVSIKLPSPLGWKEEEGNSGLSMKCGLPSIHMTSILGCETKAEQWEKHNFLALVNGN